MANLAVKKKRTISATQKKARLTMRAFANLSNCKSLEQVIIRATELVMSKDRDDFIAGTNAIAKILPYILPKQSDGNAMQVQINNNLIAGENTKDGKIVITLQELLKSRGLSGDNGAQDVEYEEVGGEIVKE